MTDQIKQNPRPYVLWRRVSTKSQSSSGLGLEAQQAIAEYFMNGKPRKIFTDVYSGTKLRECTNLKAAMDYCKRHNYLLVIAKTDRFRNVQDALSILDEMGEGNLCFCDLPTTDRTVLTIVFAIWERQAIMGRINTKRALDERIKQRNQFGYWVSKAGNICTHLGAPKGKDMSAANAASAKVRTERAIEWMQNSSAVKFARRKRAEGWTLRKIVAELSALFDVEQTKIDSLPLSEQYPNPYGTPRGAKPIAGHISKWLNEANDLTLN